MSRFSRVLRWLIVGVAILFVIAQLVRPARTNPQVDQAITIENQVTMDPKVSAILQRSCFDCHSNKTSWPWYTNVAPVSWFVINHVNEGRHELNFSEWGKFEQRRRQQKLKEICEQVKAGEMPLGSYIPLHPNSKLTQDDVKVLCDWSDQERRK